ncbi:MAG: ABC transporter substrate-binding protein [Burkholderiaceae bacterium]
MLKLASVAALAVALAFAAPLEAKTFRWASQGDYQTADPYSQNETLTNLFAQQVHDTLVTRDKSMAIVPALATSWTQVSPTLWRMNLRRGVKFHDGTPFTADDVVFSFERAAHPNSQIRQYSLAAGKPRKIDDFTVEFVQDKPNPVMLEHIATVFIMSKAWASQHKVEKPLDFKAKEETYAARNAMGTGPFILVSREPGVKSVLKKNPAWWGTFDGNVDEIVYTPISSDATRVAALLANGVDFILDPPPQDLARLRSNKDLKVLDGQENRIVFFGFDQARDELLYSNVKGKNPFKDKRVRQAVYQAIEIDAIKAKTMRGASLPSGGITPSTLPSSPEIEKRRPFDPAAAKQLLAEAGYPNGFEVTLDCPNNRYINDEEICLATAAMLAKIGITTKVSTMPRATYFPKLEKGDTSMYMLGWGGAITDAQTTLDPVLHSQDAKSGKGNFNYGRYLNPKLDALIDAAAIETDAARRKSLVTQALTEHNEQIHHVPLHRQVIPWAMRANVNAIHRPDNWVMGEWVRLD